MRAEADDHVYFVETRGRGVFLRAMPIDVTARLKELLFDQVRAAVLTSATLAVDGGFTYVKDRLGIEPSEELLLPSPFHYRDQALLYVPKGMPEPMAPEFVDRAAEEVVSLVELSRGRAFVLFTSYANMNAVAERIAGRVPYPILIQGEAPKAQLLDTFRATPHAVLLATTSFWQGVDVAGEQLSCVIVDKLPFASPGDPGGRGAHRAAEEPRPEPVRRVPGAGRRADAEAGARPADPLGLRLRHPRGPRQPAAPEVLRPAFPREPAARAPGPRARRGRPLPGLNRTGPTRSGDESNRYPICGSLLYSGDPGSASRVRSGAPGQKEEVR